MSQRRPNILFIMADDHATQAISAYDDSMIETPNIDRLAAEGIRLDSCFCTNSLCAPSRASILTGTYNHTNGVRTLSTEFDNRQMTFPGLLHDEGYQTAIFGKWHLGEGPEHDPRGFDDWAVLPGQGDYADPEFITADGRKQIEGYVTDITTDLALDWLNEREKAEPWCLLVTHKAPHRPWDPPARYANLFDDVEMPMPGNFYDDYSGRADSAKAAKMRISRDLNARDLKGNVPDGLTENEAVRWKYQKYVKDYLRCVAAIDDGVGRLLTHLDETGLAEDTIVVYTSDQGFFLGEHGWFDKRFMYEESLRMPMLVRYPREIAAGAVDGSIVTNVDFAQTLLDMCHAEAPSHMQGRSFRPLLIGQRPADWRRSMYYRYWEHDSEPHAVRAHYGIRTERYKLIFYYSDGLGLAGTKNTYFAPEWELFDLEADPKEMNNVYGAAEYADVLAELSVELETLQRECGDSVYSPNAGSLATAGWSPTNGE